MNSSLSLKSCVKSAWVLARKNHWLWFFGFFFGSSLMSFDFEQMNFKNLLAGQFSDILNLLKEKISFSNLSMLVVVGVIMFLFFVMLSIWARTSLVFGINSINGGEKQSFGKFIKNGFKLFPKVFLLEIILALPFLIFGAGIVLAMNYQQVILFAILSVLALLYALFVYLFKHYSYCAIIIDNQKVFTAIKIGFNLFRNNFQKLILAKLVEIGLWIVLGASALLSFALAFLPFILIGMLLYFTVGTIAFNITVFFAFFFLSVIFFVLKGFCQTMIQAYLTNVYTAIK